MRRGGFIGKVDAFEFEDEEDSADCQRMAVFANDGDSGGKWVLPEIAGLPVFPCVSILIHWFYRNDEYCFARPVKRLCLLKNYSIFKMIQSNLQYVSICSSKAVCIK